MATQTSSGARVVFEINNTPVLFANAVSYEVSHGLEPLYQLDSIHPAEFTETQYSVTFSVTMFRSPRRSGSSQGFIPQLRNILSQPELTARLLDKVDNATIFSVSRLKCDREAFEIDARSLGTATITFRGIKLLSDSNV